MTDAQEHNTALLATFAKVLASEETLRRAENELCEATTILSIAVAEAQTGLSDAWRAMESLMSETGEFEVILPGSVTDYRVGWNNPRTSVKVETADAVPDGFVKMERKPKLKEIGDHLRTLSDAGAAMPNWAHLETGERKLQWKAVKKGAS